jgi:hypothetical protein
MTILQVAGILYFYTIENISGGLFFKTAVPTWRMKEQEREREEKLPSSLCLTAVASGQLRMEVCLHENFPLLQTRSKSIFCSISYIGPRFKQK